MSAKTATLTPEKKSPPRARRQRDGSSTPKESSPAADSHLPSLLRGPNGRSPTHTNDKPPDSARNRQQQPPLAVTTTVDDKPIWLQDGGDPPLSARRKPDASPTASAVPSTSNAAPTTPMSPGTATSLRPSDSSAGKPTTSPQAGTPIQASTSAESPFSLRQILDATRAGPSSVSVSKSLESLSVVGPSPDGARPPSEKGSSRASIDAFFASEEEPPAPQPKGRLGASSNTTAAAKPVAAPAAAAAAPAAAPAAAAPAPAPAAGAASSSNATNSGQPAHRSSLYALTQQMAPGVGEKPAGRKLVNDDSLTLKRSVPVKYSTIRVPKDKTMELRAFMTPETRMFIPSEEYDTYGSARDPTSPNREAHDYEVQASLVVRIAAVADVRVLMNFAKSHGLSVCVLGGATPASSKMADGYVLCDLRGLNSSQKTACIWYIN